MNSLPKELLKYFLIINVLRYCTCTYCTILYCTELNWAVLYCTVLYYTVHVLYLSHVLKNTANQRPGLPLHILQYATSNMQWVVFHSTFLSLLTHNSLLGSIWELLKSQLQNSLTPVNCYEHFWSHLEISEDFWTLLKISEGFSKNFKKP